MLNHGIQRSQEILTAAKDRVTPLARELKARQDAAFRTLHSRVQEAKASPGVQIAVGATITGLLLGGRPVSAAGLAGAWLGSCPLTHLAAGGLACAGAACAALRKVAVPQARSSGKSQAKRRKRPLAAMHGGE